MSTIWQCLERKGDCQSCFFFKSLFWPCLIVSDSTPRPFNCTDRGVPGHTIRGKQEVDAQIEPRRTDCTTTADGANKRFSHVSSNGSAATSSFDAFRHVLARLYPRNGLIPPDTAAAGSPFFAFGLS